MGKKLRGFPFSSVFFVGFLLWSFCCNGLLAFEAEEFPTFGPLITKEDRRVITSTDSGMITSVDAHDGYKGKFHLQFITLEPSSLFLPVLLHTDMVFYVHTGRGIVNWVGEDGTNHLEVERGDVYRLEEGSVFYVKSQPDPMREKLRIHAIFNTFETFLGPYSNITDLVLGFDETVLQIGFGVSEEVIRGIKRVEKPPAIVPYVARSEKEKPKWEERLFEVLIGGRRSSGLFNGKKKKKKTKTKTFNVFRGEPDVQNCNGWSIAVTDRDLNALRGSDLGIFMVNLTKGSMMGPHWNPKATEIAIALHGQAMVQVVCPSDPSGGQTITCRKSRFKVNEGDVFLVRRFHPMAQMSFNNDSFVFMGFSTRARDNHPQFLAGTRSVLQVIDREILAVAFNAPNTTIGDLLAAQDESIILECASCAEEQEKRMEEEIEKEREEEEAKRKEEEEEAARRREEEEARRREEEEETRRREEEEARRREEEEEARRREEEEARRRQEEEEARRREEEEARRREEEETRRREEEEEARRREQEEEARREEEARTREEEEKEEARRREQEEEAKRREEEEARRRQEEEEKTEREREEEEARRKEEEGGEEEQTREKEAKRREEEEAAARRKEEERERQVQEEQETTRREEEAWQRQIKESTTKQGEERPKETDKGAEMK